MNPYGKPVVIWKDFLARSATQTAPTTPVYTKTMKYKTIMAGV